MKLYFQTKPRPDRPVVKTFHALGTVNAIRLSGGGAAEAAGAAVRRIGEIEDRLSAFKPGSDVSNIARNAGSGPVRIHRDTLDLLQKARDFGALSGGAFDCTVRPLIELWGINKKGGYIPPDAAVEKALKLVDFRDIETDGDACRAALKKPGQALDLGGIAKGYAADEAGRILRRAGIRSAMINLGGNIAVIGRRPDGGPWRIGIQNPLLPTGRYLGVLDAADETVVTSGSNERFFIKDGVRYHHILDPRTGWPARGPLLSVTAVCACSADADALATALFVLGAEKGLELLRTVKAEAIFIDDNLNVTITPGLTSRFHLQGREPI